MPTFVGGHKKNPAANTNHKTFPKTPRHSGGRQLKKTKTRNKVERLRKNKSQGHLKQGWRYNQNTQTLLKPALKLWSQNRSRHEGCASLRDTERKPKKKRETDSAKSCAAFSGFMICLFWVYGLPFLGLWSASSGFNGLQNARVPDFAQNHKPR